VQGPFISESESDKVIRFVKKEGGAPEYDEEIKSAIENADKKNAAEPQDELTDDAIAFIFKSKQASISMLQRRFRIGYNRAARIIDEIEEKGIIGPSDGSRPRQLLMTEDEYYGMGYDDADDSEQNIRGQSASGNNASGREAGADASDRSNGQDTAAGASAGSASGVHVDPPDEDEAVEYNKEMVRNALESFHSLPPGVQKMIMDADRHE
jgi:hypothetical protein